MKGLFIRADRCYQKIDIASILYVEARKNYCRIVTTEKSWMVLVTLKQVQAVLPQENFCRIHRSFLVNLEEITAFDHQKAWLGERRLPVGDAHARAFLSRLPVLPLAPRKKKKPEPAPRHRKAIPMPTGVP